MAGIQSDYYSRSGFSVKYDLKDNFPEFCNRYPDAIVDVMKEASRKAVDFVYPMTPYDPKGTSSNLHLRDSTFIQAYKNGRLGGTCFIQWRATNPKSGYHYGLPQEWGGTKAHAYQNYSTPGTGSGFMSKAWTFIEQTMPAYVSQATNNLMKEVSV